MPLGAVLLPKDTFACSGPAAAGRQGGPHRQEGGGGVEWRHTAVQARDAGVAAVGRGARPTSLIGVSSGRLPPGVCTVSYAMATAPDSTTAVVSGSDAAKWKYVKMVCPCRIREY